MGPKARRGVAAAGTVAVAAAVNVATGMLTQQWALAWWITLAVLVVVGGGLQAWLTLAGSSPPPAGGVQRVEGTRVGRDLRQSMAGTGDQSVADSTVRGDLSQTQRDGS
ncbi:hypothetical protein GCM10009678_20790 [Actinomadura kijaniata]|uniref:Uncharacterized protein n=1 Tax=Actinomadura namibiensis TaxID=182080 RepID=A0A7W3QJ67_ACTNM|nr:hypothetical protein [Actinomadura namibiensis]MBA8949061.1 hypothetical protein [Actinomadura namibiensis]